MNVLLSFFVEVFVIVDGPDSLYLFKVSLIKEVYHVLANKLDIGLQLESERFLFFRDSIVLKHAGTQPF